MVVASGVSSAGFLTAAAGFPTLFADPSLGLDGDLLQSIGWESRRTGCPGTALLAIDCHRASSAEARKQQRLGDVSAHLSEIDPYQDGNSADRVGSFLSGFIEELDASHPRDQALQTAAQI